jgi:hypothetical protein
VLVVRRLIVQRGDFVSEVRQDGLDAALPLVFLRLRVRLLLLQLGIRAEPFRFRELIALQVAVVLLLLRRLHAFDQSAESRLAPAGNRRAERRNQRELRARILTHRRRHGRRTRQRGHRGRRRNQVGVGIEGISHC